MRIKASPYLLLVFSSLFWSGNFVLGRVVKSSIPPVGLAFWRWTIALAILLPFSLPHLRSQWRLVRVNWRKLAIYGILGVTCFNTFIYLGLHTTSAINALLVNSVIPVLIVVLSRVLACTPVTRPQAAGVVISLEGVVTIICRADLRLLLSLQINRGDLWVLLAVVCWAFYTFLLRKRPAGLHPLSFLGAIIIIGLALLAPFYGWEISRGARVGTDTATCVSILYMALFPSVLAFIFWNQAVGEVGPNKAGLFLHLMPVFGALLSSVFLGETLHLYHLAGMGLIFSGIYLVSAAGTSRYRKLSLTRK
jgi:drug/metabolite transporter (DMT)-like permease